MKGKTKRKDCENYYQPHKHISHNTVPREASGVLLICKGQHKIPKLCRGAYIIQKTVVIV